MVAIGNFDGVHKGHQEIFVAAVKKAKTLDAKAWVITFREHPQHVLHAQKKPLLLTSFEQRLALFEEFGITGVFLLDFTESFSKTPPREFVKQILVDQLAVKGVCMGFNARFGANRSGDVGTMKEYSVEYGFHFLQAGPVQVDGCAVSSSAIRELIWQGNFLQAQKYLGREFAVYGVVVRGNGVGTKLGFPTANLELRSEVLPPKGVYLVRVNLIAGEEKSITSAGYEYNRTVVESNLVGVLNYGTRPTVSGSSQAMCAEVHLIGWNGDLYGKTLEVRFIRQLREEKRFADTQALSHQIKEDIKQAMDLIHK